MKTENPSLWHRQPKMLRTTGREAWCYVETDGSIEVYIEPPYDVRCGSDHATIPARIVALAIERATTPTRRPKRASATKRKAGR